jgi:hypothetical protein
MGTQRTSLDTYYKIKTEGLLPEKRMRIYEIFYQQGNLTGSQVAQFYKNKYPTNQHSETIRNRITELVQMRVLEELGTTNCPLSNREVILYGINTNLPSKIPVQKTKKQKVSEIKLVVQKGLDYTKNDMFGEPYREFLKEIMDKLNTI